MSPKNMLLEVKEKLLSISKGYACLFSTKKDLLFLIFYQVKRIYCAVFDTLCEHNVTKILQSIIQVNFLKDIDLFDLNHLLESLFLFLFFAIILLLATALIFKQKKFK